MDAAAKRPRRLRAKYPEYKSGDLYSGYFAPAEGLYRLCGLPASHSIQRKMLPHFSIAALPTFDRHRSGNCFCSCKKRAHNEGKNGGERWHGTALSRCRSCQMSREE